MIFFVIFCILFLFTGVPIASLSLGMKGVTNVILGSGSATRKAILTQAGFTYTIIKADIDERAIGDRTIGTHEKATELVLLLATLKAKEILKKINTTIELSERDKLPRYLLTADQVITHKSNILEKPLDIIEARNFIKSYSESSCSTVGSIILTDRLDESKIESGVDICTIYFKKIPDDIVEKILEEEDCMHCAGGLMVEHPLLQPYIDRIDGTIESVMGLSLELLNNTIIKQTS